MPPPRTFGVLCQFWGLDQAHHDAWWTALVQARWSVAVRWREGLLASDAPGRPLPAEPLARTPLQHARTLVHERCAPAVVMDVLEAFVGEGALTRPCATALEEAILRAVDKDQRWCDHQQPVQARQ